MSCFDVITDMREYCNEESFTATCPHDAVIVMQAANYGRMRLGRSVGAGGAGAEGQGVEGLADQGRLQWLGLKDLGHFWLGYEFVSILGHPQMSAHFSHDFERL